ncbi:MAG TPA: dihydroorotate dehydrogenase [Dehalococcoidia bacterium]|nr:dihydroorotate dehydrogenase [Dehalococcoidia bacterium]
MNLSVELAPTQKRGLTLRNPVMTASGTFGNGLEYVKVFDIQSLGAIVSKAVTLRPRRGNPQPRIAETAAGMINSIGLQNIGLDAIVRDVAPVWATWQVPVIANVAGESVADYAELARRLDGVPGVSGIELNVSCPNVENGLEFGSDPRAAAEVTAAVRRRTDLPLLVKLTPNVSDIVAVARAVAEAGADALTLINTFPAMSIDLKARRPALGWGSGGLSGPALKPIALRMVYQVASALDIPIVGCGGIMSGRDAMEYIMAGARAVQVGTATFTNPRAPLDVLDGIEELLREQGVEDLSELVGAALPPDRRPGARAVAQAGEDQGRPH